MDTDKSLPHSDSAGCTNTALARLSQRLLNVKYQSQIGLDRGVVGDRLDEGERSMSGLEGLTTACLRRKSSAATH